RASGNSFNSLSIWAWVEPMRNSPGSIRTRIMPSELVNFGTGTISGVGVGGGAVERERSVRVALISDPYFNPAHARMGNAARKATTPNRLGPCRLRPSRRSGGIDD